MSDDPKTAILDDGTTRTLTPFERQYVEPHMYCWEAGHWCSATEDDQVYFVSDDGRVDIHSEEDLRCLTFGAGRLEDGRPR